MYSPYYSLQRDRTPAPPPPTYAVAPRVIYYLILFSRSPTVDSSVETLSTTAQSYKNPYE